MCIICYLRLQSWKKGEIDVRSALKFSPGCPLILPYHSAVIAHAKMPKAGDKKIGTTGKDVAQPMKIRFHVVAYGFMTYLNRRAFC